jgi:hypothetical protein
MTREAQLEKVLREIVIDVESMRNAPPVDFQYLPKEEKEHWFGPFSNGDGESDTSLIQWPNLGILVNQAKELLK